MYFFSPEKQTLLNIRNKDTPLYSSNNKIVAKQPKSTLPDEMEKHKRSEPTSMDISSCVPPSLHDLMSYRKIMKNVVIISLIISLTYVSFTGLAALQSSLHRTEGMGVISGSILYTSIMISSMLLSKILISLLGHKWSMAFSVLGHSIWYVVNGIGTWYAMIPGSIFVGLAVSTLWIVYSSYYTIVANHYSKQRDMNLQAVISNFFGILFMFYRLGIYRILSNNCLIY